LCVCVQRITIFLALIGDGDNERIYKAEALHVVLILSIKLWYYYQWILISGGVVVICMEMWETLKGVATTQMYQREEPKQQ